MRLLEFGQLFVARAAGRPDDLEAASRGARGSRLPPKWGFGQWLRGLRRTVLGTSDKACHTATKVNRFTFSMELANRLSPE
eukprot:COSAG02_NODE_2450_length_8834_cov_8.817401_3_plen_81_part_00